MMLLVALVLHFKLPLQPVALKVALSVPQRVVLLLVIIGGVALTPVLMMREFEALLVPHNVVQLAL